VEILHVFMSPAGRLPARRKSRLKQSVHRHMCRQIKVRAARAARVGRGPGGACACCTLARQALIVGAVLRPCAVRPAGCAAASPDPDHGPPEGVQGGGDVLWRVLLAPFAMSRAWVRCGVRAGSAYGAWLHSYPPVTCAWPSVTAHSSIQNDRSCTARIVQRQLCKSTRVSDGEAA